MEQSFFVNPLQEGVAQTPGRGSKVKVTLARRDLKGDATYPIPLVQQNALLDNSTPYQQWSLVDGSYIHGGETAGGLDVPLGRPRSNSTSTSPHEQSRCVRKACGLLL